MQGNESTAFDPGEYGEHPFVEWYASLFSLDTAKWDKNNLYLGTYAAKRFAIDVDGVGDVILGVHKDDAKAMSSITWYSALLFRKHQSRDWIVLSSQDARVDNPAFKQPIPVRLFIPCAIRLLDAWEKSPPKRLIIQAVTVENGKTAAALLPHIANLPVLSKGSW